MKTVKLLLILCLCMGCTRIDSKTQSIATDEVNPVKVIQQEAKEESDDLSASKGVIDLYISDNALDTTQMSYAIQDLETGVIIQSENASENFVAASVYKLPLCMLWYDKINSGEVSKDEPILFSAIEESGGYLEQDYCVGQTIPLSEVLRYTIVYSDNNGAHLLFNNLGGWPEFKKQCAKYSSHEQNDEFYSYENYLNAEYMCDVLKNLYDHKETYSDLIGHLQSAIPDDFLNSNTPLNMAQKAGWLYEVQNASGLSLDGHPYSISVFTTYGEQGKTIMGNINKICFDYFNE
ncbi:serine hydrolase [Floccifex sp.]|uniref:serine hydrolase n=1 Tax=Floccifex sp. TaxID=2815810 RepID=UPI003F010EAF